MEIVNHECYVSPEVAKLLEQTGFDWEVCDGYIIYEDGHVFTTNFQTPYNFNGDNKDLFSSYRGNKGVFSKPTLDVAQRWLREVKGIYIGIVALEDKRCVTDSDTGLKFHYEYMKPVFYCDIQNERCETISTLDDSYGTYEDAQEAGIEKSLEIILKQGE